MECIIQPLSLACLFLFVAVPGWILIRRLPLENIARTSRSDAILILLSLGLLSLILSYVLLVGVSTISSLITEAISAWFYPYLGPGLFSRAAAVQSVGFVDLTLELWIRSLLGNGSADPCYIGSIAICETISQHGWKPPTPHPINIIFAVLAAALTLASGWDRLSRQDVARYNAQPNNSLERTGDSAAEARDERDNGT